MNICLYNGRMEKLEDLKKKLIRSALCFLNLRCSRYHNPDTNQPTDVVLKVVMEDYFRFISEAIFALSLGTIASENICPQNLTRECFLLYFGSSDVFDNEYICATQEIGLLDATIKFSEKEIPVKDIQIIMVGLVFLKERSLPRNQYRFLKVSCNRDMWEASLF